MVETALKPNDWVSDWHSLTGFKSVKLLGVSLCAEEWDTSPL